MTHASLPTTDYTTAELFSNTHKTARGTSSRSKTGFKLIALNSDLIKFSQIKCMCLIFTILST